MNKIIIILIIIQLISFTSSKCQVLNDDCSHAANLDTLIGQWVITDYHCIDSEHADTSIFGNIDSSAIANFPYPHNTNPCEGYSSSIAAPARDLWYYIPPVSCDISIRFYCSDTTHISVWFGSDCMHISPQRCFTILPSDFFTETILGSGYGMYLQISSTSTNSFTSFWACLTGSLVFCPTDYVTTVTPSICNNYKIIATGESYPEMHDGVAYVSISNGNSPFFYQWSNGSTDSMITNLSSGWYSVTITDADNCVEVDSVEINTITEIKKNNKIVSFDISSNPNNGDFTISINNLKNATIAIYNSMGIKVKIEKLQANNSEIKIKGLSTGVYYVVLESEGKRIGGKVIVY
ncbi:MAG: hypothetical protein A2033_02420 [Bacteroidetes bacterium GWA2_31_9]|nr:MAG: hypothetical protein A2033_02420 [Bacteroidetes bacterium GWA2_31_9]